MLLAIRHSLRMIREDQRRRWMIVLAIAVLASFMEAAAAVMIFVLLGLVNNPGDSIDVPLIGDLRDSFPGTSSDTLIVGIAATMAVFFLLRGGVLILQAFIQNRTAQGTGAIVSRKLFAGYLAMPYAFHLSRNSAESIRNAYQSVSELVAYVLIPVVLMVSESLVVLAMLVVLAVAAPVPTAVALAVLAPLVFVVLRVVQPRLRRSGESAQSEYEIGLRSIQQGLRGVREIKVLGREGYFEEQFGRSRTQLAHAQYIRTALTEVPRISIETSLLLLIVSYLGITAATSSSVEDSLTVLGLFGYAAFRVLPGMNRVVTQLNNMKYGLAAADFVVADLDMIKRQVEATAGAVEPLPFRGELQLEDVHFRYSGAEVDALAGVELTVRPGESIGIVGPTGSGKTTLVDVILGLLAPSEGSVRVDGVDIHADLFAWQRTTGVVPQMVFLLDDTLRHNIALGIRDDEIDEELVDAAVRLAQLEDFVRELPDGLDAMVGESGVRISGGQRQRVAIARALYHQPSVLFFDEGTSALDQATEAEVIAALERLRGERTIFTVAHRLSTVRTCDRVVLVRDGQIVDSGPYESLAERHAELRPAVP
ncbi:MAG: ABC transporter ATP-binding protein [Thermoleophilaceae bacterium]|nr:ABC transporter ATP-binding protein [Thermoleophilaceae bacterium]